jgi:hypothetical protein
MPTKRRGPFRTVGMRMQDFGRSLMRHYVPPQRLPIGQSSTPPPAWQADAQTPLIWGEPEAAPTPVENLPIETPPVEIPPVEAPPVEPAPVQPSRRSAPAAQRKAGSEEKIDPRLLAILDAHQAREKRAAQIREERHAAAKEIQRQVEESGPDAPPTSHRRSRASFDYVETKALLPPDEEGVRTPPKTPAETIQPARQPDQPQDDDDAEESRAAGTFIPEAPFPQSTPPTLEDQPDETTDLAGSVVHDGTTSPQSTIQRTSEAETPAALPLEEYAPSSDFETLPVRPEGAQPTSTGYESAPASETTVQRESESDQSPASRPIPPTSESAAAQAEIPGVKPPEPTVQRKPDATQSEGASESQDETRFSPSDLQPPSGSLATSPDVRAGEMGQSETLRPMVQRQVEQPGDKTEPPESPPERAQAQIASSEPIQTPPEQPIVQGQIEPAERHSGSIPVEPESDEPAHPMTAQAERPSDTPAERAVVQRQTEVPPPDEGIGSTAVEPGAEPMEHESQQTEPAPSLASEPPKAPQRPVIQRQIEAAEPLVNEAAPAAAQQQAEQAVDTREPLQSPPEHPIVQRRVEPAELLGDRDQVPVETEPESRVLAAPISEPDEPSHPISAQAESVSDTPAERAVGQRQIETLPSMPSDEVVASTAFEAEQEPIEDVSRRATPTAANEPTPTVPEQPIQQAIEQPSSAAPRPAEPIETARETAYNESAPTEFEPTANVPADIETIQPAPVEPPMAQRETLQAPAHEDVGQSEIEDREAVSELPASTPVSKTPTVEEGTADIPAQVPIIENVPTLKKPDMPVQRTIESTEPPQQSTPSETFSAVPEEEPTQQDELPLDALEAMVAAGMVSEPPEFQPKSSAQPGEIQRKSAEPESTAEANIAVPSEGDETFTPEIESEQPLDVFEAMVAAGMVPPTTPGSPGRTEIARKPVPAEPTARPTPPAAREQPVSQSSFPNQLPVHYAGESQVVMREETDDIAPQQEGEVDVHKLARDVYSLLRQRLRIEKERRG